MHSVKEAWRAGSTAWIERESSPCRVPHSARVNGVHNDVAGRRFAQGVSQVTTAPGDARGARSSRRTSDACGHQNDGSAGTSRRLGESSRHLPNQSNDTERVRFPQRGRLTGIHLAAQSFERGGQHSPVPGEILSWRSAGEHDRKTVIRCRVSTDEFQDQGTGLERVLAADVEVVKHDRVKSGRYRSGRCCPRLDGRPRTRR